MTLLGWGGTQPGTLARGGRLRLSGPRTVPRGEYRIWKRIAATPKEAEFDHADACQHCRLPASEGTRGSPPAHDADTVPMEAGGKGPGLCPGRQSRPVPERRRRFLGTDDSLICQCSKSADAAALPGPGEPPHQLKVRRRLEA